MYAKIVHFVLFFCKNVQISTKKEGCHHDNPTFVNLKSNTMKNTMQRYCFFDYPQAFASKNAIKQLLN